MTVVRLGAPTLFGKLPTRGDYVVSGERGHAESLLAEWLTRAVEVARGNVPPAAVQFVARPAKGATLIGSWVASRDALGRAFPLVFSRGAPGVAPDVSQAFWLACDTCFTQWVLRADRAVRQRGNEATGATPHELTVLATCSSPDLPRRTPDSLATTRIHEFALACFVHAPLDNLCYALWVLQRASRPPTHELTLDVPAASDRDVYLWLALLQAALARETAADNTQARALEPTMVLWSSALSRALVSLGPWSTHQLVYLSDAQHEGHGRWPLWTQRHEACVAAQRELDPALLDCIERDDTLAALIALVGRAPR